MKKEASILRCSWLFTNDVLSLSQSVLSSLRWQDAICLYTTLPLLRKPWPEKLRPCIYLRWVNGQAAGGLTHWGWVAHLCVSKLTIVGSDNGLSPGRRQAIIWTNAAMLLIQPLGTNFIEILIEIHTFSFKKMHLKISSAKWQPFFPGGNELTQWGWNKMAASLRMTFSMHFLE